MPKPFELQQQTIYSDIRRLEALPAFTLKIPKKKSKNNDESEEEEEKYWTAQRLMTDEDYEEEEDYTIANELLCFKIADMNHELKEKYYSSEHPVKLFKSWAMRIALNKEQLL